METTQTLSRALEALKASRRYIDDAYDAAFPDAQANEAALLDVDQAIAGLEALLPKAQLDVNLRPRGQDHRFFSFNPDNGALWHATAQEASDASRHDVAYFRDAARSEGEWPTDDQLSRVIADAGLNQCFDDVCLGTLKRVRAGLNAARQAMRAAPATSEVGAVPGVLIQAYVVGTAEDGVTVERAPQRKGADRWAVRRHGNVLNKRGEWEYEPSNSNRDDDFFARCRYSDHTIAIAAASAAVATRKSA